MSAEPAPGVVSGLRHCLDDAVIDAYDHRTVMVTCVSPNRARRLKQLLDKLQKDGPDR